MTGDAVISDDGVYRYRLSRVWNDFRGRMAFVMLNPSTADAVFDDPTIRRCIGFAKREGFGGIEVVNLFAYRTSKPVHLLEAAAAGIDVRGPENFATIAVVFAEPQTQCIVAAWGAGLAGRLPRLNIERVARDAAKPVYCLGRTKTGHPRHPLYLKTEQPLEAMT